MTKPMTNETREKMERLTNDELLAQLNGFDQYDAEFERRFRALLAENEALKAAQVACVKLEEHLNELPEGDVKIEFEHVMGGWVGYVFLTPVNGPIVPVCRESIYARTNAMPSRSDAIRSLPEALKVIKTKALKRETGQ